MSQKIIDRLLGLQDVEYKEFHSKLMPTIDPDKIIGVRTPQLRKLAGSLKNETEIKGFMEALPHYYYEENNLHGFFIEKIKDYDRCIEALNRFLPYVDNWATCDMMNPKVFKKHLPELLYQIKVWIGSDETYTVRFAIKTLMNLYLDENYLEEYSDMVANVTSGEYYIKMAVAWYFATALAKQYDRILPYLLENRLDVWTHNKAIQKAVESYRITPEQKGYLKTLKRK